MTTALELPVSLSPLVETMVKLYYDPALYVRQMLHMEPTSQQDELYEAVRKAITGGNKKIAARSGHGIGKTRALASLNIWFLDTRKDCLVINTAAKEDQLEEQVWAEARLLLAQARESVRLRIKLLTNEMCRVSNPHGARSLGRTARQDNPDALQGFHHDHLMVIADEATGIPNQIFGPVEGMLTKPDNIFIMTGNPTKVKCYFHDAFTGRIRKVTTLHFSSLDSPLVDQEWAADLKERYGENSNLYRVRVLGEFLREDQASLITLDMVSVAAARGEAIQDSDIQRPPVIIGLDPGRSQGRDPSAMVARSGARVVDQDQLWSKDGMEVVGRARAFRDSLVARGYMFSHFAVDTIGTGGPIYDRFIELGEPARAVNVALPATTPKGMRMPGEEEPFNLRAELWLAMRSWLRDVGELPLDLPYGEELKSEVTGPRMIIRSDGRIQIEGKHREGPEEAPGLEARGIASPNLADALSLTFFEGAEIWQGYI